MFSFSTVDPLRIKTGEIPLTWLRPFMTGPELDGTLQPADFLLSASLTKFQLRPLKPVHVRNFAARLGPTELVRDTEFSFYPGADLNLGAFDASDGSWSLHWMDSQRRVFFPPAHGRFEGGRGIFYADDTDDGVPVKVRYLWLASETAPRWEQAFSRDEGQNWETNWIMNFTRAD